MYDKGRGLATVTESSNEDTTDLLTSPLARTPVGKLFVVGGPLGLAVAIVLSLWVSYLHVRYTALVQVQTQWVAGEPFAVRAQVVPETSLPLPELSGTLWAEQGERRVELGALSSTGQPGILQAVAQTPALNPGAATLHVELVAEGGSMEPMHETIEVQMVASREGLKPRALVAGSPLQHGDDTEPQPPGVRIVVRPAGRLLSEFDNRLWVRVTHPDGRPFAGRVQVALVSGEFDGQRPDPANPPVLSTGDLDRFGLFSLSGRLTSAVLRLEVRVLDEDGEVRHRRRVRMVSFAGSVVLVAEPPVLVTTDPSLELRAQTLRRKRPVFVDVHTADGGWISTLTPALHGGEVPRPWSASSPVPGVLQFEAYHFTNDPGESTAIARVQVVAGDPSDVASVRPLVEAYLDSVDAPRVELDYDAGLERAYAEALPKADMTAAEVETMRAYLLDTLPLSSWGPPTALMNRDRVLAQMAAKKRRWTIGMRWFLLGGGGLFLMLMTATMMRAHATAASATMDTLRKISDREQREEAAAAVSAAKRAALLRGLGVIGVMAAALVLATVMLESLLWAF